MTITSAWTAKLLLDQVMRDRAEKDDASSSSLVENVRDFMSLPALLLL